MNNELFAIFNTDNRQHINLSLYANEIVEYDMVSFNDDHELKNKSGFLNTIIANYYDEFPLAHNVVLKELTKIDKDIKGKGITKEIINSIVAAFGNEFMKNRINEFKKLYPNEYSFKLRINNNNKDLLESLDDGIYFNRYITQSPLGFYLKILIESYTRLPFKQRERIYFKETFAIIDKAIRDKTYIKIKQYDKFVKLAPIQTFHKNNKRLTHILCIGNQFFIYDNFSVKDLTKAGIRGLKEKYKDNPVFKNIANSIINEELQLQREVVKVRFSKGGLTRYKYEKDLLSFGGKVDKNDIYLYEFNLSIEELYEYFFKYGNQVEVISPTSFRETFIELYQASVKLYEKQEFKG